MFPFLCKFLKHKYVYYKSWKAESIIIYDSISENNIEHLIILDHKDEIKTYSELLSIIDYNKPLNRQYRQRCLITLKCARCGHRITVDDDYYLLRN